MGIKTIAGAASIAVAFLLCSNKAGASNLKIWYQQPGAVNVTQGLLLGNGRMGAIVPGGTNSESIVLNDSSLWTGEANLSGGYTTGVNTNFGAYQLFGNLVLNLPGHVGGSGYSRALDIGTGVATVDYTNAGVAYHREIFCSAPDQVLALQLTASAAAAYTGSIQLTDGHSSATISTTGGLMFSGSLINGEKYEAQLFVTNSGGTLVNSGGTVSFTNCSSLTILVALGTDYVMDYSKNYHGNDPHANVVAQLTAASAKSFATLETAHTNDFQSLFNRVSIWLGNAPASRTNLPTDQRITANAANDDDPWMEQLMFQYGRYLMISSSRTGLPMNLQGLWNDNNNPDWASDYHTDINIEMMYWQVEEANLPECFLPFVNFIQSQIPAWRYVTTNASSSINNAGYGGGFGGTNGWTLRTSHNINGGLGWNWLQSGNAWYCMHLWEHYAFTGDTNYLLNTAYPILKETCQFWQQHLVQIGANTNGLPVTTLVATNGWSPEHGPNENGVSFDQELIWDVFNNYQQACSILNTDAVYSATVSNLQSNLLVPGIGPWGELREWLYNPDSPTDDHRHTMHLVGLYPGRQFSAAATPALTAAARVGLLARGDTGDSGFEWAHAWRSSLFARLHDWWSAHHKLQLYCGTLEPNLVAYYSGSIAQWDGSCGVTAGITEMLLQSHQNEINLLPALPNAWPAGTVTGLVARGGYTVGITWTNASASATIQVGQTGNCRVRTPNPATVTSNGIPVAVTNPEPDVAVWPVTAGGVFTVTWVQPPFPANLATSGQNGANVMAWPMDFATGINIGTTLGWISGGTNYLHDVYFDTSSNSVATATTGSAQYLGRTSNTNFPLPLLSPNTRYYWRVDEIAGTNIGTGTVWQFVTASNFSATNPVPATGQARVPVNQTLSWTPGVTPNTNCLHNVYLGTTYSSVASATTNSPQFMGQFASPRFTPTNALQVNTIYYWRVDEVVGGAVSPGTVWTFTTAADQLHSSLYFYYTFDSNNITSGTNMLDSSGTPPNNGVLDPISGPPGLTNGQVKQAMLLNGTSQYGASPAPGIGTSNATFLCWLNRNGSQSSYAGIMFCRGSTTVAGLDFNGANNTLGYHWNNESGTYNYNSGLTPPASQWALAALVVTPTNATFYLGTTNGALSSVSRTYTHVLQSFDGPVLLGSDGGNGRYFHGAMDEACFWTRSLLPSEIGQIFTNGLNSLGLTNPPPPSIPPDSWTGGGADNNWSTPGNWGGTAPNSAGDNLVFTGSVRPNNTNNSAVTSVGWIQLNPSMAFTNNGTALTIASGLTNSAQNNVWNLPLTLGANQTIDTAANTMFTLNGVISGGYGLTFADSGKAVLAAANTFAGGTTVNGGTLVEKVAASGGTGALTINAGARVSYQVGQYAQAGFSALNILGGTFSADAISQNQVNAVNRPVLMQGGILTSTNGLAGPANDGGYGNFLLNGAVLTISGSSQSIINSTTFATANGASFTVDSTGAGIDLLIASVINGGSVIKKGAGTLALTGKNTYTGATTVSNGVLLVNGSIATGSAVTITTGATLEGAGVISGPATIQAGATLAPGNVGIGILTFSNNLTLAGITLMDISKAGGVATNSRAVVTGTLALGGSLVVTNISTNALAAGDTFKIFNAASYSGSFASLTLPALTNSLAWITNLIAVNGTLTVTNSGAPGATQPPAVTNLSMAPDGSSFTLTGTGAVNQDYVLLTSTNLSATWIPLLTNQSDSNGTFNFIDPQTTNYPSRFYRIGTP